MAEKVSDGVNGLHFRAGDAQSLATVMSHAATAPALWENLRVGITPVTSMEAHVDALDGLYRSILEDRGRHGTQRHS